MSVMVGTGVQLAVSTIILIVFACMGFLSPANRGALMQVKSLNRALTGKRNGRRSSATRESAGL